MYSARQPDAQRRRRVELPVARSVADLPRAGRRPEGLGRRPQRAVGLPQRLRLDDPGPRPPGDRRRDQGALRPRHPLRRADRGRGRGRRGAGQALPAAEVALHELGLRVDDGRDPHRAGADQARPDHEDVRLLPRPPRRGDGLDRRRVRRDRPARGAGVAALRRRDPAGDRRPHLRRPLQRRREPRPPPDRARQRRQEAGLRDHGGGDDEPRRRAAAAGVPRGGPRDHPAPRRDPDLRRGQDRPGDRGRRRGREVRRAARHGHAGQGARRPACRPGRSA